MKAATEADVLRQVLQYLRLRGHAPHRMSNHAVTRTRGGRTFKAFHGTRGMADVYVTLGGRPVWVECKRPGGKLSPDQKAFLEREEAAGALCLVVRSLDDLTKALEMEGLDPDA